jgi:3'(2'), 5'-bisphosphate nucleotidase
MFKKGGQYAIALALVQDGVELVGVTACPNLVRTRHGQWLLSDSQADVNAYGWMLAAARRHGATVRPLGNGKLLDAYKLNRSRDPEPYILKSSRALLKGLHFVDSKHSPKTLWRKVQQLAGEEGYKSATQLYSSHMRYVAMALGTRDYIQVRWPNSTRAKWSIWDHVGTPLIYAESGPGKITDMYGRPIRYDGGRDLTGSWGIITADRSVHLDVQRVVCGMLESEG